MKGVPIKFRGKSEVTGKTIYGIGVKVFPDYSTMILDSLACEDVEEDSVAQLVGYDVNHNEIYEDDELVDEDGNVYRVCLTAMFIREGKLGFNLSPATVRLHQLTLKGE